MRYATPAAFERALANRLRARRAYDGQSIDRMRTAIAFERLMARLLTIAPNRWVLKGGFALDCRLGANARTTQDIDFVFRVTEEEAIQDFRAATALNLGDFFTFTVTHAPTFDDLSEPVTRIHSDCQLAGKLFRRVTIDVSFQSSDTVEPDAIVGHDYLDFADVPRITIPTIPLSRHIAEKVHAYTRLYASGTSSRVKDLVDIVAIAATQSLIADELLQALTSVFSGRAAHLLPSALPPPPDTWAIPYRRLAAELALAADLASGYTIAQAFLDPLLAGKISVHATWDAPSRTWRTAL